MGVHRLDAHLQRYYHAGLADSSHRVYRAAGKRYADFCATFSLTPYPATESCLCYFVTCVGDEGLADSTIKSYMAGIRHTQISLGLADPMISSMPRLGLIIKGIKNLRGRSGSQPFKRSVADNSKYTMEDEGSSGPAKARP